MLIAIFAKSKKYGGRCIAGIEVEKRGREYEFVRPGGEPKWVRPVSTTEHGEVPASLVERLNLLDVVEFAGLRAAPEGFQSENYKSTNLKPRLDGSLNKSASLLDRVTTTRSGPLFGNRGKAIHADKIGELNYSLVLIAARNSQFTTTQTPTGKAQLRVEFDYEGDPYDLPVTDPEFERFHKTSGFKLPAASTCYLTLSVGQEFESFYYKLVAGVFVL
jgi:hypothetical protein